MCGLFSLIVSSEGQEACEDSTFVDESCLEGWSYVTANAASTCAATPCVYDTSTAGTADNAVCCSENSGEKCSDFVSDGTCGQGYTERGSGTKCELTVTLGGCDLETTYDMKSCCKPTTGQKCGEALPPDGWCNAGTTYDTSNKNFKCVGAECDKTVLDDQNSCCSTTKGSVTCKEYFGNDDGECSSFREGFTYDKAKADKKCVGTCDAEKLDDTNTCCMATTGLTCGNHGITQGMCGPGLEYDEKKKNNKCVSKDGCDMTVPDDVNTCCSPLKGAGKCGATKVGAMVPGFCGPGMEYDDTKATNSCSGVSCSKTNKDDVKTCCKSNDGEGYCKDMDESLCGIGKSKNPATLESSCTGKVCGANEDDTGTCCMDNEGASCSDAKNGATEPMFCGDGTTYKVGTTNKCKQAKCASALDKLSCCMGNAGQECSKITAVTTFCGTGKVIDTSQSSKPCASSICSPSSAEDVKVCCKTAPKTTVTTTKAPTKNATTPGITGSAHANLVGATSLLFMGCLSQLM